MRSLTAAEAATELGTDPKTLRRFLRQDPTYRNAGSGGRYTFTDDDLPKLKERYLAWQGRPRSARQNGIEDAPGLPARVARSRDPRDLATVRALSTERVDRLEAALREKGLHISQMRDRETWGARSLGIMA